MFSTAYRCDNEKPVPELARYAFRISASYGISCPAFHRETRDRHMSEHGAMLPELTDEANGKDGAASWRNGFTWQTRTVFLPS